MGKISQIEYEVYKEFHSKYEDDKKKLEEDKLNKEKNLIRRKVEMAIEEEVNLRVDKEIQDKYYESLDDFDSYKKEYRKKIHELDKKIQVCKSTIQFNEVE
ncbi:hypothetical protein Amet_2833 [Alkaliphilus metalliredigens QYMF]|uniref:Uncharacterized protein n=1 Tax=Alkaliphilus metalliredigens (strain QYMF) TaxID=293826 RepID=A6TS15_ALKMQ|nr:hypothetical protein [Alkaliphilus metalliredigens]ABR48983.1 hypothetical protein Amet_2833 [Alkaliphilus metalliredigens QYMF]